jgi:Fe-S oxidoreductase
MPKTKVSLDVTNLKNFVYDMDHCIKCKGCYWVDHIYMPGVRYSTRCPSATRYVFDSYGAFGKMRIGLGMVDGKLKYSKELLDIIYKCTLCGACDVGCKRNLDLEIELSLEAMRVKAVADGAGPMPAHKKIAQNISKSHNRFGIADKSRTEWLTDDIKTSAKADILYFAGCSASYRSKEIAKATVKILGSTGAKFTLLPDEWCCGNIPYSVGMIDEARELAKRNIAAIKKTGVSTVLTSCAECYRTLKVDYPKMLNIATKDLGFKVVHLVEYVDELIKKGTLKFKNSVDLRVAYHDACSLSRLSEPWTPWKGERGLWGVVTPDLERRRGSNGVYHQPRNILNAIPGIQLVETIRKRENNWCCGGGRGVTEAYPDFALWTAEKKLEEVGEVGAEAVVSACPWCKDNLNRATNKMGDGVKVYDISELILKAISR